MPYVARRRTTKRYRKRYNRRGTSLAKKAYRLAKKAYKLPELKWNQLTATPASANGTGSITSLSDTTPGTGNNGRIGSSIKPTSLKYRMAIKLNASATDTLLRMIIFRWISESPTGPSDILESPIGITSFKDDDERYQSQILKDVTFRLSTAEKPEMFIKGSVKLYSKLIAYADSATVSNKGGIYVLFVSDENTNTPSIAWQSRLYYRDA